MNCQTAEALLFENLMPVPKGSFLFENNYINTSQHNCLPPTKMKSDKQPLESINCSYSLIMHMY